MPFTDARGRKEIIADSGLKLGGAVIRVLERPGAEPGGAADTAEARPQMPPGSPEAG